jgi:hypothetical protein
MLGMTANMVSLTRRACQSFNFKFKFKFNNDSLLVEELEVELERP